MRKMKSAVYINLKGVVRPCDLFHWLCDIRASVALPLHDLRCKAGRIGNQSVASNANIVRVGGKRGRPSRDEEREISSLILEAALKLFLQQGYGATSMKRVGEVAGVAPNTLYARYPDKEALFKAIIDWKVALWQVTNPPSYVEPGKPMRDAIAVAITAMIEAMDREDISALGRLLTLEAVRFPKLASIYHDVAVSLGFDGLVESIRLSSDCDLSDTEIRGLALTLLECAAGHMTINALNAAHAEPPQVAAKRIAAAFTVCHEKPQA